MPGPISPALDLCITGGDRRPGRYSVRLSPMEARRTRDQQICARWLIIVEIVIVLVFFFEIVVVVLIFDVPVIVHPIQFHG